MCHHRKLLIGVYGGSSLLVATVGYQILHHPNHIFLQLFAMGFFPPSFRYAHTLIHPSAHSLSLFWVSPGQLLWPAIFPVVSTCSGYLIWCTPTPLQDQLLWGLCEDALQQQSPQTYLSVHSVSYLTLYFYPFTFSSGSAWSLAWYSRGDHCPHPPPMFHDYSFHFAMFNGIFNSIYEEGWIL